MKRALSHLLIVLLSGAAVCHADEPPLARLAFWLAPERLSAFEAEYAKQVLPLLERHGLVEAEQRGRQTPVHIFARLFELEHPTAVSRIRRALDADAEWHQLLAHLGEGFGAHGEREIRYEFEIYDSPAGPGEELPVGPGQGAWRNFTTDDGLASGATYHIFQDQPGNYWFSGPGGLTRYDGQDLKVFTRRDGLATSFARTTLQDRNGTYWFGTRNGLTRYDGQNWKTYTTRDGLPSNSVQTILEDQEGHLWFGTKGGGVARYDGETWTTYTEEDGLASNIIYAALQDSRGHFWFGHLNRGLSRFDGEHWTTYSTEDGLGADDVWDILEDRDGHIWLGTRKSRVSHLVDSQWTSMFPGEVEQEAIGVPVVLEDADRHMWFGTYAGAKRYDGETWFSYTVEDGLAHNVIWSGRRDRDDVLWFGTQNGVSRYDEREFLRLTHKDGMPSVLRRASMVLDRGALWLDGGHHQGLYKYDGRTLKRFTVADGLPTNAVHGIIRTQDGALYLGCNNGGIVRFDGKRFTTFTEADGLPSSALSTNWNAFQDPGGGMWFPIDEGIMHFDGEEWSVLTIADGLPDNEVWDGVEDHQGYMWFATPSGLCRYDPTGAGPGEKTMETFTIEDGLADTWTYNAYIDRQGRLWAGSPGGISVYDPAQQIPDEKPHFTIYDMEDGLANNEAWAIFQDAAGYMWIGTADGVSKFDGQVFQTMTSEDGVAGDWVNIIRQDEEGHMWFGTGGGELTRFKPLDSEPPTIAVLSTTSDRRYEGVDELSLATPVSLLSFEFAARSFKTRPEAMVYRYRLKSFDDEWKNTNERRVEYQDLPRGDYTFEVQAVDRDLVYSEQPATVRLNIHWPYGQLTLVAALCLALVLAGWQTYRVLRRGRALHQSNEALQQKTDDLEKTNEDLEKARIAAESSNHAKSLFLANMSHEIRTPMNAILGYAQILQRSDDLQPDQHRAVDTIQTSGDHLLKLINNVLDISKIEAGRMELQVGDFDLRNLVETVGTMFELQCREKGLGWTLEVLSDAQVLVHGDEGKLQQILINLLGNAAKFTEEGQMSLCVQSPSINRFRFEVTDTGPGISPEEQTTLFQAFQQGESGLKRGGTGLGLTITQKQLGLMGSRLEVESTLGEGACFFFEVDLPPAEGIVRSEETSDYSRVEHLAPGFSVTILVADDVAQNREILHSMLADIGCSVETADNGRQALEHMERSLPDLVFLDIRMPVLDGVETLKLLQENEAWKQVKVVAVSASVLEHERQQYLTSGFDDFIDKPFRFERICQCLAQQLDMEFSYAAEETRPGGTIDWNGLSLPSELHQKLHEAAGLYSVTEIEDYLDEVENIGTEHQELATHLRQLNQNQDMDAILSALTEIDHE